MTTHLSHSDPDHECYKWTRPLTDYDNNHKWVVIVGYNFSNADADETLEIRDQNTDVIDVIIMARFDRDVTAAGATTTKMMTLLPRRCLVPPLGRIVASTTGRVLSLIECCCLEKALMIL